MENFGGAYIPKCYTQMLKNYAKNKNYAEPDFKAQFDQLLKDYVGRPSPLYFATRLSEKYNTKSILKERI
jgi:tryptophan synthase beta chain